MPIFFPSDQPKPKRIKSKPDIEPVLSGLLIGVASICFAACLLLVLNGTIEKWIRQFRQDQQASQVTPRANGK